MSDQEKYERITFRPSKKLQQKIAAAMDAGKFETLTSLLDEALPLGIEVLERQNWDIYKAAVDAVMGNAAVAAQPRLKPLANAKKPLASNQNKTA